MTAVKIWQLFGLFCIGIYAVSTNDQTLYGFAFGGSSVLGILSIAGMAGAK